jgi:hypothetical protein
MAITEKTISVDSSFKVKIGETEISLSREEADKLYEGLFRVLGKKRYPDLVINHLREYPCPMPVYISPSPPRPYYEVGDFPPFDQYKVTC